jgi:hypothetical protein
MVDLSFLLSRAAASGRAGGPRNRESVLAALLRKRAEAHRHGLEEQEQKLREQIRWALPVRAPDQDSESSD